MRYRAKDDIILEYNGKESFVAKGDKVFIQQHGANWKVFSLYTREGVCVCTKEELTEWFAPEEDFQSSPGSDRFKGRKFGGKMMTLALLILPLLPMAQISPVQWSFRAVRVDSDYFELHLTADIFRGWWIYEPNRADACPYSPILTFERSPVMKPVERLAVLEATLCDNEISEAFRPPLCPIQQYHSTVTFVQLFKMPAHRLGTIKGQIQYQAISRYTIEPYKTVNFSINVGDDSSLIRSNCTAKIITTYPRGAFRKTLWFLSHPFGPHYINRKVVTP